ncbi:MAG: hypothetical protein M9947_16205 [Thermomicrobiales bacterium]|nr:hypothetical protein [Thermomicrobiales bacterium]
MSPRKKQIDTTIDSGITGVVGDAGATRSGHDSRKRGWYWHWNATITQFAPLIGLKGVGLLNSYTVWTDRREESPTRGYAFPSQQSEADFYGEDRAELITINKILVALDLIEIRKEMVVRPDEQGRRWKVPHNFYRVKDRDDGYTLDGDAVMRVVRLADKDKAVYRYLHHIFSEKFKPIDAQNVWTTILAEVRTDPTWQKLAEKTAADERRASERTRLGHASRKEKTGVRTQLKPASDSATVASVTAPSADETSVASSNRGLKPAVAQRNKGSEVAERSVVAPVNEGQATNVAPSNRTYYQEKTTTTTRSDNPETTYVTGVFSPEQAPGDQPNLERTLRRFAEANGREATAAERKILKELAERFDLPARESGRPELGSGWAWVSSAIYEAVDSGSSYVATKRIREILLRWERDGLPSDEGQAPEPATRKKSPRPRVKKQAPEPYMGTAKSSRPSPETAARDGAAQRDVSFDDEPFAHPVFDLGRGLTSVQVWASVLSLLQHDGVPAGEVDLWLRPLALLHLDTDRDGERLLIGAPNRATAQRVEQRFRAEIETALSAFLGRAIQVEIVLTHDWLDNRLAG